jgi:hypothetical protein
MFMFRMRGGNAHVLVEIIVSNVVGLGCLRCIWLVENLEEYLGA